MADRGSTEHSPRLDDEMERETRSLTHGSPVEARAEEWHQMEPPGDGEPFPGARVSIDDVERRSLLAISLRPSAFPADRERLVSVAAQEHADDAMLVLLASLPEGVVYPTFESVWEALGGVTERREHEPAPTITPRRERAERDEQTRARATAPPEAAPEPPTMEPPRADPLHTGIAVVVGVTSTVVGVAIGVASEVVRRMRRLL